MDSFRREETNCHHYQSMKRFSISTDIAAPPTRVWQVMSDVDRWHEWTASITSVKRLGDRPLAVGTRVLIRQPKFPPALWRVADIKPGASFTWVSVGPGFRATGRHALEPTPTGSRATLSIEFDGMFAGLFGRITGAITERYIAFEAKGLKARSESSSETLAEKYFIA
jgi:hypothetical protein